jgi:putative heme-binding domain-containing protein
LPILAPHAKSPDHVLRARALFQLGRLGGEGQKHVRAALSEPDPDIRVVAIRSLKQNGADLIVVAKLLATDPSPQVRRELLLSLRDADPAKASDVLVKLANQYDGHDRYYLEAIGIAFRGREATLTPALVQSWPKDEWSRRVAGLLWLLGPPEALPRFTAIALDRQRDASARQIAVEALGGMNDPKAGLVLARLVAEDESADILRKAFYLLARKLPGPWRGLSKNADRYATTLADVALRHAKDPRMYPEALALSRALGTKPLGQWMLSQPYLRAKVAKSDPPLMTDKPEHGHDWARARVNPEGAIDIAAQRLRQNDAVAYAATVLNVKEGFTTRLWIGSSAGVKIWHNNHLLHEQSQRRALAPRQESVAVTLAAGVNRLLVRADAGAKDWAFIVELEDPLGRAIEVTDQSLPKISAPASDRLDPKKLPPDRELLALKGNSERGRQVFLRSKANCASCHKIKGEGGATGVGPTLDGLGVKMSREAILAEMIRPSQSIGQQYVVWNVQTKAGKTVTGIIVEDQPEQLLLKDAQGKTAAIRKQDIAERQPSDVSLMPALLAGEFTRQELADLVQFLAELR